MRTEIGGLQFVLAGAARAWWPAPSLHPLPLLGGEWIEVAAERGRRYLVVDHRAGRGEPGPARIEYWASAGPAEGGLEGMFVLCDSAWPLSPVDEGDSLVAIAGQIGGGAAPGPTFYAAVAGVKFTSYGEPPHSSR